MTPPRTLGSPVTHRPPAPAELDGLVVLVTGGSRGIGAAVADAVLAAGGSVCLTGRDAGTLARRRIVSVVATGCCPRRETPPTSAIASVRSTG